jgi:hypothetical protein
VHPRADFSLKDLSVAAQVSWDEGLVLLILYSHLFGPGGRWWTLEPQRKREAEPIVKELAQAIQESMQALVRPIPDVPAPNSLEDLDPWLARLAEAIETRARPLYRLHDKLMVLGLGLGAHRRLDPSLEAHRRRVLRVAQSLTSVLPTAITTKGGRPALMRAARAVPLRQLRDEAILAEYERLTREQPGAKRDTIAGHVAQIFNCDARTVFRALNRARAHPVSEETTLKPRPT